MRFGSFTCSQNNSRGLHVFDEDRNTYLWWVLMVLRTLRAVRHPVLPAHAAASGRGHRERVGLTVVLLPVAAMVLLWVHLRGGSIAMRVIRRVMLLLRSWRAAAAAAAVASAAHADALAVAGVLLGGAVRVMASTAVGAALVPVYTRR